MGSTIIKNLAAVFTGESFEKKEGRRITREESDLLLGPIDIEIGANGRILRIEKNLPMQGSVLDGSGLFAAASFIDSHTHSLFAGNRAPEFFQRWRGDSYVDIAKRGGGILNTMRASAESSDDALLGELRSHLDFVASTGITDIEIKSGYAQDAAGELRLLRVLKRLSDSKITTNTYSTFLGLHALPKGKEESAFVSEMIALLPQIQSEGLAQFIDAFPEKGFFSLEESLRFAAAGLKHGLRPKIHADELSPLGSAESFSKLGALSVDHLQQVSDAGLAELARSNCVATLLPATSFFLGLEYAPARKIIQSGARFALSTDYNPGTAPDATPQFTMRLAAAQFRMSPQEIFCAFTYGGAAALGIEKSTGTLLPGKKASFCLWKVSPHSCLEELTLGSAFPLLTLKEGQIISSRL